MTTLLFYNEEKIVLRLVITSEQDFYLDYLLYTAEEFYFFNFGGSGTRLIHR